MKILLAVDGSECSQQAVEFLVERPFKDEDQFMVLMVKEIVPTEFGLGHMPESAERFEEQMYEECAEITASAGARLKEKLKVNSVEAKVTSGLIAQEVCRCAEEWQADLVVMGSHGRKGFQKFLLGSVAEEVLKKAPCSVEIIKGRIARAGDKKADKKAAAEASSSKK